MEIGQLLARVGAQIVQSDVQQTRAVLLLRVDNKPASRQRWARLIEQLLLFEADDKRENWTVDIGHTYFLRNGAVRYLWRVILDAKTKKALKEEAWKRFQQAALSSLAGSVEVTEFALVGRSNYEGKKTMGVHSLGTAETVIQRESAR